MRSSFIAVLATALLAGCRQDMHDAPRYEAFEASATFADNRVSRTPPAGTVPRGWLREDEALYTGKAAGQLLDQFPFAIAHGNLRRIVRHRAEAVGDHVEEVADLLLAQAILVE